ncbi:YitT family protein [Trichococcus pasteurii]|uniref:DUF2179 domain-containing protein n=1 Tax=Trichococcus pasteurii TaxID=43064 RepID=A0A1W1IFA7_9LACT|nr:YitT family protein [Trichococcus pasteurii]SFE45896.1 Uncharacterized membrane-anchored protein YitT, contains DUF161 and DUF2179 domains [Trichococcus pasteurii]SLM51684.1 Hypothetical protein TPAS_1362 [Trichococcus pasteurii]SSB92565.1 Hypothetical protein TPAS_1362 [Trichococcus pasteurii]
MKLLHTLKPIAAVVAGNIIVAFAIAAFILPKNLIAGGTTGLAIILNHFFGLNISLVVLIFNGFMFFVGAALLGKKFALTTILSTIIFPTFLTFFRTVPALQDMTDDILLSAIYAGILCGLGVGLVFKVGASTGGMDIPPLLLNKHFRIPVAVGMYAFDVIFLLVQAVFSSMEQILYGLIMVFLTSIVINKVMVTGRNKMQLFIISKKFEEIKQALLYVQDVGLTLVNIETAFEGVQQQAVLCVVEQRKLSAINALVNDIDPFAFVIIGQVHEVAGKGFTLERQSGLVE